MGRIKGTLVKRTAKSMLLKHKEEFTASFEENKKALARIMPIQKKIRNSVAGYIARIVKREKGKEVISKG